MALQLNTYYTKSFGQDVINGLIHEMSEGRIGSLGGGGNWGTMDLFRYNSDFAGPIDGLGGQNAIFLENTSFTGFSFSNDLLTVKNGSTTVASLNAVETSNMFSLTSENHGVLITFT